MKQDKTINLYDKYVLANYKRIPVVFEKGKGISLWDAQKNEYMDFFSGWAVSGLGHCPDSIVKAVKKQATMLIHVPNNYYNMQQGELAKHIVKNAFAGKVFFCNSGAEANEAAIKLARRWQKGRYEIISMSNSFHGRTMGAITATAQPGYHQGFEPMLEGFKYAVFNDINSVKDKITEKTSAIMLEPIQGEGGINVATKEFISGIKDLCKRHNLLLIFDEVQCGMGRTGKMFAYQWFDIKPDLMTLAKSLGGGVAIGATLIANKVKDVLCPGTHASTFGGNPLACAAGVAVFKTIKKDNLLENSRKMGSYLKQALSGLKNSFPNIIDEIRGEGLMLGVQLRKDGSSIVEKCFAKKLLINCTHKTILRLMPPIIVKKQDIDHAVKILREVLLDEN